MDVSLAKMWDFLLKPDETLGFPLIYIVVPLVIIALLLLLWCLFCCCRYYCCDTEIHVVPSLAHWRRSRQHAPYIPDYEEEGPSPQCHNESTNGEQVSVELDLDTVCKVNKLYEKRQYVSHRRKE